MNASATARFCSPGSTCWRAVSSVSVWRGTGIELIRETRARRELHLIVDSYAMHKHPKSAPAQIAQAVQLPLHPDLTRRQSSPSSNAWSWAALSRMTTITFPATHRKVLRGCRLRRTGEASSSSRDRTGRPYLRRRYRASGAPDARRSSAIRLWSGVKRPRTVFDGDPSAHKISRP